MKRPLEASVEGRGRIVGITDGVFAIALTLIVLEIRVPAHEVIHSEHDLLAAIAALAPRFLTYALSFLTLTIFWFGQQAQHGLIAKSDRRLATLNLCFLAFIALLPFSTDLLADFLEFRTAVLVYWLNLLMLGITLFVSWRYAEKSGLVAEDVDAETKRTVYLRIVKAQVLWAVGAAFCLITPLASVGFILVVQLIYAATPNVKWVRRIIG
ncbi:TMEM175 family protein [Mesorhizobium sp. CO1-1-11]|uniref:TMEM175 family protein n=1 Tax=Mesorhizobium sp. CO1-1-11 TaxID=2876636 RepID=UPI001CCF8290|nr:TMEM175 family protein [Mesorhizobium sp. CO1-1-11]MBZ9726653.1 TMEM175 family protein [Mesorhizobium sp. CO1-1-11]